MLTADVHVEDFEAADWLALTELLTNPSAERAPAPGLLLVLTDGGRVVKAASTGARLDPSAPVLAGPLSVAAKAHGARVALRFERAAVSRVADEIGRRVANSDHLLGQLDELLEVFREFSHEGVVEVFPSDLLALRAKSRLIRRFVDSVCPPNKTVLFAAFEGNEVRTSIALHRSERGFDRVVGPLSVRTEMGLVSGDFARDSRGLARAVELSVGPLSVGCFAETKTWRRLLRQSTPGAWASAVAAREMVFHPMAPALAIPLGVDVGRAALAAARVLSARLGITSRLRFDPFGLLTEFFDPKS